VEAGLTAIFGLERLTICGARGASRCGRTRDGRCECGIEIIEKTGEATGEEVMVLVKGVSQSPCPYAIFGVWSG